MNEKDFAIYGTIDGVGIVSVTEGELEIPHFNVTKPDGSKASIMIEDTMYMPDSEYTLTGSECKKLNEWFRQPNANLCGKSNNWTDMIFGWYGVYYKSDWEWDWKRPIPDYTTIKPYKE